MGFKMKEERFLLWLESSKSKYHPNAYKFVLEALRYTQCHFNKPRHVTGQELLLGITRFAKEKFGDMAYFVFEEWGVKQGRDFGHIVFQLVEVGEIKKTADDSIDDFDINFDLKKELNNAELII